MVRGRREGGGTEVERVGGFGEGGEGKWSFLLLLILLLSANYVVLRR